MAFLQDRRYTTTCDSAEYIYIYTNKPKHMGYAAVHVFNLHHTTSYLFKTFTESYWFYLTLALNSVQ